MKNAFLLSLLIIPFKIFCCSFAPEPFCTTILKNEDKAIVYGIIVSKDDDGLDLEVIEVLKGDENRAQIRIWDGQDFDCNGPFDMSVNTIGEINDTILILLPKIDTIINAWDVIGDYTTPTPYGNTPRLFVNEGIATGFITGGTYDENYYAQTTAYEALREAIITTTECADIILSADKTLAKNHNEISIQNPVSSMLTINQSYAPDIVEVNIYSLNGEKLVSRKTEDQLQIVLPLEHLPDGLFIVHLVMKNDTHEVAKIVKN